MATVIDQLLVTLGLDASKFKEGAEQSNSALDSIAAGVSRTASGVGNLALKIVGLTAAAIGVKDFVGHVADLVKMSLPLQMMAENLGIDEKQLLILGETSQQFAGHAEDAANSINGLQSAIFNLRFKGEMSDQLIMLQRLGVQFQDSAGHMRNFNEIAMDTSRRLQAAGLDEATRYQYALSAGFTGGIATGIAQGPDALAKALASVATANKSVTDKQIDALAKLDRSILLLRDRVDAQTITLAAKATPAVERLAGDIEGLITWLRGAVKNDVTEEERLTEKYGGGPIGAWIGAEQIAWEGRLDALGTALDWITHAVTPKGPVGQSAGAPNGPGGMFGDTTTVDIGSITINTTSTDPKGIAAEIPKAIARKRQAAQADTGVVQ